MDTRIKELSELLVNYSCKVKPGEKVLISYEGEHSKDLARQLIKDVYKVGGVPFAEIKDSEISREILLNCTEEQIAFQNELSLAQMKGMDAFIGIRGGNNSSELRDVPSENMNMYTRLTRPTNTCRIDETKWVVLRYPNNSMAQLANTSLEAFEDFYFNVCVIDYERMSKAMEPLVDLMNRTDRVHIKGPGTDITFSIKGIGAQKCDGHKNIPDGEVYTAPVAGSMNGVISYNVPSEIHGFTYENIVFEVEDGKIVKATSNDDKRINELLDTDEGARHFGEFAIGVHPRILHPINDTLFDEKIAGSFHLTPGTCYEDASNGNKSALHWDLVMVQRPEYGGGEIWFDDVLIRKDGIFVVDELKDLNPENLG